MTQQSFLYPFTRILNLGEKLSLSVGWLRTVLKKCGIEDCVSILKGNAHPRCAKDGFSLNRGE